MPREEIDHFFDTVAASDFSDPITGLHPKCERELSAILAVNHLMGKVQWNQVVAHNVVKKLGIAASDIVRTEDIVVTEYPLFAQNQAEINRWGQMAPDLVFFGGNNARLVFVEVKVDSHFTHSNEPPDGQVSRYLEFIASTKAAEKALIIICPKCNYDWYKVRLERAANCADSSVTTYIIVWEDLFPYVKS